MQSKTEVPDNSQCNSFTDEGVRHADAPVSLAENGFVADSIVDGPGLRTVVFVQGCPHACPGCHNPATHPFTGGNPHAARQLYDRIVNNPLCGGVTLSGGEPFCQAQALAELALLIRRRGLEVASYTGYTFEQLLAGTSAQRRLLALCDILIDGPYLEGQRDLTLRFRGSRNQRVLDVPASLKAGQAIWTTQTRWLGK